MIKKTFLQQALNKYGIEILECEQVKSTLEVKVSRLETINNTWEMPGPSPVGFCKPCGACILTTCDKLKLYLKVTIDLNNCMFTLSKQSSSSTKELHGPHWISPFWLKTSKAAVMSRFVSGYYGDDLLWSGFIDIPGGRGKLGY